MNYTRLLCCMVAVCTFSGLMTATPALATTYTVLPDGTGDFPTIQVAVNAALDGDVIQLGDGTFTGVGNRDIGYLGKAITVRSISGDSSLCIIDCQGEGRGFSFESGEGASSVLQGVTVTNGFAGEFPRDGGGIFCWGSSPTLSRIVLLGNQAPDVGGGMYCGSSSPTLTDVVFLGNSSPQGQPHSGHGGGMYSEDSSPTLTNVTFSGNTAQFSAGGMACYWGSAALTNVAFSGNSVAEGVGGGMWCTGLLFPTFVGVTFSENSPYGLVCDNTSATLTHCAFLGNEQYGMWCVGYTSATVTATTFSGNGGGIVCEAGASAALSNVTVADNSSFGILCQGEDSAIYATNTIVAFTSSGGGIVPLDSTCDITLACCDIFGNAGGDWSGCIADQLGVRGNISQDPLFCREDNPEEPYTIDYDSPCAPDNSAGCGLVGAWHAACGEYVTIEQTSWGSIKAMYR